MATWKILKFSCRLPKRRLGARAGGKGGDENELFVIIKLEVTSSPGLPLICVCKI